MWHVSQQKDSNLCKGRKKINFMKKNQLLVHYKLQKMCSYNHFWRIEFFFSSVSHRVVEQAGMRDVQIVKKMPQLSLSPLLIATNGCFYAKPEEEHKWKASIWKHAPNRCGVKVPKWIWTRGQVWEFCPATSLRLKELALFQTWLSYSVPLHMWIPSPMGAKVHTDLAVDFTSIKSSFLKHLHV